MAEKKIFSIGFRFPGDIAEYFPFTSNQSLLDADIVVFEPDISDYHSGENFQGKRLLYESDSFKLDEDSSRWRTELKIAFESGKTVFIFLSKLQEVFIHTGQKEFSGTGRSRLTKNIVAPYNNYCSIPLDLGQIVPKGGKEIRIVRDLEFLSAYWKEFGEASMYEVYLEGKIPNPILSTKTGNKIVGAIYYGTKGTIVLLPPIRYDELSFRTPSMLSWTKKGKEFGRKLAICICEIDKILRTQREGTPPPDWTRHSDYRLEKEYLLENKIKVQSEKIEELENVRRELSDELNRTGALRKLLYEAGSELEEAILEALIILGFDAKRYRDAESEFDVLFSSPEGRFLGEVEGRDSKAIAIEKLSQLERNLQEDFMREEVTEYAKGVLFGNAFRLLPPSERSEFFTTKCLSGAKRSKIALVRTTDLFHVIRYLKEHNDPGYAKSCRETILRTEGCIVEFPLPPLETKSIKKLDTFSSSCS